MKPTKNYLKAPAPSIRISWKALMALYTTVGQRHAETGALLCGPENQNLVTDVFFDNNSRNSGVTYTPDNGYVNRTLKQQNAQGQRFKGFNHSHPRGLTRPSGGDEVYARRILDAIDDLDWMWMPITQTIPDTGAFSLYSHAAVRDERHGVNVVPCEVVVTEMPEMQELPEDEADLLAQLRQQVWGGITDAIIFSPNPKHHKPVFTKVLTDAEDRTFDRVVNAYDLPRMHGSRIIAVGMGGAAAWAEDTARAGVMQWVLIDPDTVSETNLATQQTYRKDIGRPKVDCVAERLREIHPDMQITTIQKGLEELSDDEMQGLAFDAWNDAAPVQTVLCGLTDNFYAQARVNRLALKFALPSLCAQVYLEGRGAEVTYTHPDVTPACHRCVLSSRYRHYLEQGMGNDVTSHGTPIFATTRLNAIKGFVLLALLHHGSHHPRWGGLLARMGKRNLIQVRMDPDIGSSIGLTVFDRVNGDPDRHFFDDVVWLPQDAEAPPKYNHCPDCGGSGSLRSVAGIDVDTRSPLKSRPAKVA
jgi:proteasome lid subunit RPN8/RPN11